MISNLFIEASCKQIYCNGERVCGDVFHTVNVKEEGRRIIVLSDGMGHGVKANILGILTATMAARFTVEHKETSQIAETILNTLPIDSEKKTSFSTFTVVDIEADGKTTILEYENPQCLVLRGDKVFQPQWNCLMLNTWVVRYCAVHSRRNKTIELSCSPMVLPRLVWEVKHCL